MKRVYVAAPYTADSRARVLMNVQDAIADGNRIDGIPGVHAFVPHLYHFWDELHPAGYERWMAKCLDEVARSDALFRRPAPSPGASREEYLASEIGIPVFRTIEEVEAWVR